jgi:YggT family protein
MGLLAILLGLYSLLIIIRIILTWFSNAQFGKPVEILARITDPYLDWWRQKLNLRAGILDLSPIAAIAALSVLQTICSTFASQGRITIGIILAVCLSALWSAASFILGFCFIVLVLRLIAYFANSNMYSGFWRVIDSFSQPMLYRINRIIFGKRMVRFLTGIFTAIAALAVLWIIGRFMVRLFTGLLLGLPV